MSTRPLLFCAIILVVVIVILIFPFTLKINCLFSGLSLTEDEGHYFHDLNHHEQQENPHDHHEQQENPIYGNISIERRGERKLESVTFYKKQ